MTLGSTRTTKYLNLDWMFFSTTLVRALSTPIGSIRTVALCSYSILLSRKLR